MTPDAIKLKNRKNKLWRRYSRTRTYYDHQRFVQCRNELRALTRTLRASFEKNFARNVKHKPKLFWKYINSRLKTKVKIPTLNLNDGSKATSIIEKVETLNKYFCSVFSIENTAHIPPPMYKFHGEQLITVNISPDIVKKKLLNLSNNKSPGIDTLHPFFLKNLANTLSVPLSIIYNKSLDTGTCPYQWLEALITATYKNGSRDKVENYRPISLTSVISKVMESIVRDAIVSHMVNNGLFADKQHGFVPMRSCSTQLLVALESWCDILDNGGLVDVIYTDFAKAFDTVPHERLAVKMEAFGITGKILRWVKSFLHNRRQKGLYRRGRVKMGRSKKWHSTRFCAGTNIIRVVHK